jgi:MoaA/NifB/PqqE/SkfB family radical SAM enzyme
MANLGYIQLTRNCLQHCRFCSNPPTGVGLDEHELCELIDRMSEMDYDGVILTGGEPSASPLLFAALERARERGLYSRMITNGQYLADKVFFRKCVDAGLTHVHMSLHSWRPAVHDFITRYPGAHEALVQALAHVPELGITADINCVINTYNADHLDQNVAWICENFPHVRHFVWNHMDPDGNRAEDNPDCIPHLREFQVSLERAMLYLERSGRTFRAERVPLCVMPRFAWASTETRKIVKEEERCINFLDGKGWVHQLEFLHGKSEACRACSFDPICAGLYSMARTFDERELSPIFEPYLPVVERVLGRRATPELLDRLEQRRDRRSETEQPSAADRAAYVTEPMMPPPDVPGLPAPLSGARTARSSARLLARETP